ncbi:dienelactone hydrolase family protein [Acinetobacter sp. S40]|uniref:alpha/beta hydrolase n=1 Tax=unclassified Acinetobacter TaxID=196816 RepID=UPI00190D18D1|nr:MULTISPECIES: dienelactone hydrolase family protein [unclassified Acinetobacter]MBJ9986398.1 dienelactone hydrolase family protein [Acinetobacter sp. S40]MBK0063672.1 dienelactone hydrolase family protein [Acinetobacter sp. S55]MBK0067550.1 dienelactone hydrolase family protein [Acinetobacter sp. S54]
MAEKLVIMFHGVGSNGRDLLPIAQYWQRQIEGLSIASPNAPFPFMQSHEVFQWFSLTGITEENRFERIEQAREYFDQTVQRILDEHDFKDKIDQVVFCGFSQGTIMSLDAVASGRWPIAGVIGFSGRLASPIEANANQSAKITLMHGEADEVIPVYESQDAFKALREAGFNVELEIYQGLGHSVNELELKRGLEFLKSL